MTNKPEDLRIGHTERDATATALREAFAVGHITLEELDERLDLALSARTAGDLARVTADLPAAPSPAPRAQQKRTHGPRHHNNHWHPHRGGLPVHRRRGGPGPWPWIPLLVLAVAFGGFGVIKYFILFWVVLFVAGMFHHRRLQMRHQRR
ncbi:hypothetical protein Ssi02_22510 [Sinosporangium siamense]|uniref:DUF1707 domain-containing protein n=1 Tax=Sinosporangium siamense TaxID=1367973 RepID=A0A919RDQ6_9ACTN|nr:hypothetical protein Ssi02_22510 [Sinosporangium siamense]